VRERRVFDEIVECELIWLAVLCAILRNPGRGLSSTLLLLASVTFVVDKNKKNK